MRYFSILSSCMLFAAPLALAAVAATSAGCGPGTTTVSCEVGAADGGTTSAHVCTQYDNEPEDAVTDFDSSCASTPGAPGVPGGGCITVGVLGSCRISSPLYVTTVTEYYYAFGSQSSADAETDCTSQEGATWTNGG